MTAKLRRAALAAVRFGVGARPGDLVDDAADPAARLAAEVSNAASFRLNGAALADTFGAADRLARYQEERKAIRKGGESSAKARTTNIREGLVDEVAARLSHGVATPNGFAERLVWFWSNHFTVAAKNPQTIVFAGPYEREAIRARLTGKFADLHLGVMRHPAMLHYLDQAQSIGPNSRAGLRRKRGLNENLAREALELHTLGAQGGYTQADVTEFARALTGWTVVAPGAEAALASGKPIGSFVFIEAAHEPGARVVIGRKYPDDGPDQARAILADLARRPQTALRVATQLCRRFIADEPPAMAIRAVEKAFLETDGDLPSVHRALIEAPESWAEPVGKMKSPNEFIVSALRAVGAGVVNAREAQMSYRTLGEAPFGAPSPEGWPDASASWTTPDAVMRRLEWAERLAQRVVSRRPPQQVLRDALGPLLTAESEQAISRAQTGAQGLVIGLMSPDFMRR